MVFATMTIILTAAAIVGARDMGTPAGAQRITYDKPYMTENQARYCARFDTVCVDIENGVVNPEMLALIRKINPRTRILAFVRPDGTRLPLGVMRPLQQAFLDSMQSRGTRFFLRDDSGRLMFDPRPDGGYIFNISADCPPDATKRRFGHFAADFYLEKTLGMQCWDGMCLDDTRTSVLAMAIRANNVIAAGGYAEMPDADNNGSADCIYRFTMAWLVGIDEFVDRIARKRGRHFVIIK